MQSAFYETNDKKNFFRNPFGAASAAAAVELHGGRQR